jgi:integrase
MSTKMRNGVRQRRAGGGWQFVVELPPDATGKRRRKTVSGFATQKAAEKERRDELKRLDDGGDPYPERLTARAYIDRWIGHQADRVRPRTLERYRQLLDGHVLPVIGDVQLDRVRPAHVQAVLDAMRDQGRKPRTRIQARAVLCSAMRQALEWELIAANPVAAVKPPKAERPKLAVPTAEQIAALIEAARAEPVWEIPLLLASTTGARRSEVLAVSWPDVDLKAGKVRITVGLQKGEHGRGAVFADVKTDRARRELVLLAVVVERLRWLRKEQAERRLKLGSEWHDLDLVCDRGDGLYLTPDAFSDAFKRIAARAGLDPATRLHDVRHGVATTMLAEGVHPAIASAVLGHSSPAFTMSVYQHVTDGMTEQAAVALGRALGS